VFGNVGTLIAFRVGHPDAEILEKEFGKALLASTLADLDRYQAAVKLLEEGENHTPFLAKMVPPIQNRVGRKDKLIARSRERFATPRVVVEQRLARWMAPGANTPQESGRTKNHRPKTGSSGNRRKLPDLARRSGIG